MSTPTQAQTSTLESLKDIIRRDLNLRPQESIPDDMPLMGGDFDLDSLDILMLIISIEKKFGVNISSEQSGRDMFKTVGTLAAFIDSNPATADGEVSADGGSDTRDLASALDALPHQSPFRFVTELTQLTPGQQATGIWRVTGEEAFFAGHFPDNPLVPGVLISESLAQLSGIAFASDDSGVQEGRLAAVNVRFRSPVSPPAQITLKSQLKQSQGDLHVFAVEAQRGDETVAEGTVTLYQPRDVDSPSAG